MPICNYDYNELRYVCESPSSSGYNVTLDSPLASQSYTCDTHGKCTAISQSNISLTDESSLDNSYAYNRTLSFTVNGLYTPNSYYYSVIDAQDHNLIVNWEQPATVTYVQVIDSSGIRTNVTATTNSNTPLLYESSPTYTPIENNCSYIYNTPHTLYLIPFTKVSVQRQWGEMQFNEEDIAYTTTSSSIAVESTFDGSFTTTLTISSLTSKEFDILSQSEDNLYVALITMDDGTYYAVGCDNGLYITYSTDNVTRTITLTERSNLEGIVPIDQITNESNNYIYVYTSEHDGYVCEDYMKAYYLLQREEDILGKPTGNYKCMEGYQSRFPELSIIGTFTGKTYFITANCQQMCEMTTNIPTIIQYTSPQTNNYEIDCDTEWTIDNAGDDTTFTVTPLSGEAGKTTIQVKCNEQMSSVDHYHNYVIIYCNGKQYNFQARLLSTSNLFPNGTIYAISANYTQLMIPTNGCVSAVAVVQGEDYVSNLEWYSNSYIRMNVISNPNAEMRQILINVKLCDNSEIQLTINQSPSAHSNDKAQMYVMGGYAYIPNNDNSTLTATEISPYKGWAKSLLTYNTVTAIDNSGITDCKRLTAITLSDSTSTLGTFAMSANPLLSTVHLSPRTTAIPNYCFSYCTSLNDITIPSGVTSIGQGAFQNSKLYKIYMEEGVTTLGSSCFNTNQLLGIHIPSSVTSIEGMAMYNNQSLHYIQIDSVTPPTLGSNAVGNTNNCPIYVPSGSVQSYKSSWSIYANRIEAYPWQQVGNKAIITTSTETINIPNDGGILERKNTSAYTLTAESVIVNAWDIGNSAFQYYQNLSSITLTDDVRTIGANAFYSTKLKTITFGYNLEYIGANAFNGTLLQSIRINSPLPPKIEQTSLTGNNFNIYVPQDALERYQQAPIWSNYTSRLRGFSN